MRVRLFLILFASYFAALSAARAEEPPQGANTPFTVEYLYRVKWGHFDEFMALYKKNHWPVLAAEMERGHMLDVRIDQAHDLAPETHRWDIRVTITWKNVLLAHELIDRDRKEIYERLYPNQKQWKKEEQRRFQLLDGLQTVSTFRLDTEEWLKNEQN